MGNRNSKHASTKRSTALAGSRRRSDVATKESDSVRNIKTLTIEELEKEWTSSWMMLAFAFNHLSCDVHENCDGSCSNGVYYPGPPLIEEMAQEMFSMLSQVAGPRPSLAGPQDSPRNLEWAVQQNLPSFKYSEIDSLAGEIRLLRLKKGLFRSDIVECDIITTSLGRGQEFQALSYRWGSGEMSDVMLCNGKRLHIYPSLNAALKTFRESPVLRDQLLWSDAVSIDQANKREVSEQILLMRRIYTEATGVFVHLGLAERQISLGLDLMHRLATVERHLTNPEQYGAIPIDDVTLPPKQHSCWTEYFTLFLSPWISRTWILQEIALARKATLGIGRYVVDWDVFEGSFHFLKEHGFLEERMATGRDGLLTGLLNFVRLQEIRSIARSPDSSSLMKVLRATRNFEVTDPRDKVVGMLGIIGDLPTRLKALSDRSLNTAQVYHRTALYLLETPSLPDVFAHAGLQRRVGLPGMPSWVPDWYADNSEHNERPLNTFRPTPFLAGGRPQNCVVGTVGDSMYPRELLSPGFCHHRIIRRSNAFDRPKPGSEGTRLMSQACFAWFDSARTCLEGGDALVYGNIEEAFARTLLVDDLYTGNNAIRAMTAIDDVVKTFRAAIARLEAPGNANQHKTMKGTTDEQVQTFLLQMMAAIRGRRFAITDTGYMCLAPSCVEIGDAVAILLGFPTPFTIRLDTEPAVSDRGLEQVRAQLVGDTYMHGVMHAESFTEAAQTGRLPCEIVLI